MDGTHAQQRIETLGSALTPMNELGSALCALADAMQRQQPTDELARKVESLKVSTLLMTLPRSVRFVVDFAFSEMSEEQLRHHGELLVENATEFSRLITAWNCKHEQLQQMQSLEPTS